MGGKLYPKEYLKLTGRLGKPPDKISLLLLVGIIIGLVINILLYIEYGIYSSVYAYGGATNMKILERNIDITSSANFYYKYVASYSEYIFKNVYGSISYQLILGNHDVFYVNYFYLPFKISLLLIFYLITKDFLSIYGINKYFAIYPVLLLMFFPPSLVQVCRPAFITGFLAIWLIFNYTFINKSKKLLFLSLFFMALTYKLHITTFGALFILFCLTSILPPLGSTLSQTHKREVTFVKSITLIIILVILTFIVLYHSSGIFRGLLSKLSSHIVVPIVVYKFIDFFISKSPSAVQYLVVQLISFIVILLPVFLLNLLVLYKNNLFTCSLPEILINLKAFLKDNRNLLVIILDLWIVGLFFVLMLFNIPLRFLQYFTVFSLNILVIVTCNYIKNRKVVWLSLLSVALLLLLLTVTSLNMPQRLAGVYSEDDIILANWVNKNIDRNDAIFSDLSVAGILVYNGYSKIYGPYWTNLVGIDSHSFDLTYKYLNDKKIRYFILTSKNTRLGIYPYNTPFLFKPVSKQYLNSLDNTPIDKIYVDSYKNEVYEIATN